MDNLSCDTVSATKMALCDTLEINDKTKIYDNIHLYPKIFFNLNIRFDYSKYENITYLKFGKRFNQHVIIGLPINLTHLVFGSDFNQPIDYLPDNLKYLDLRCCFAFNQSLDNLPPNLISLALGACFNQSVDNLPSGLKYLSFGRYFNQNVDNLPSGLTYLAFNGDYFTKPLNNIPTSVEYLILDISEQTNINVHMLPDNIKRISINKKNKELKYILEILYY